MTGDERVRHCTLCDLNVHNFAAMTGDETRELLARSSGRICGRIGAAVMAAVVSISAISCATKPPAKHGPDVTLDVAQAAHSQQTTFLGIVRDAETGGVLPGVTVVLRDEATGREEHAVTDVNGVFSIECPDGRYRVEIAMEGFQAAVVEKLELKQNVEVRASVALQGAGGGLIGVITTTESWSADGVSTTFPQNLIEKLPI